MVHVVVGMNRLLRTNDAAGELDRAIGDHLVGIHVGLCPRSGLKDNQWKLAVQLAVDDILRGTNDQIDFHSWESGPGHHSPVRRIFFKMPSARITGRPQR